METQKQILNNNINPKEKTGTLQNLISKLSKNEPTTFGNYYVDFNEMFKKEEDYKDYLKKHVSLFNDDLIDREKYKGPSSNYYLKKEFFENFQENTLFYIFYYLTRDTLQLFAGEQLYKRGWLYHPKYQIWFKKLKDKIEYGEDGPKYEFFNPLEWKKNEYIYGQIDEDQFMKEEESKKLIKQYESESLKKDKKKAQPLKSTSNQSQQIDNSNGATINNNPKNSKSINNGQ